MKLPCMTDLWLFEQLTGPERKQVHSMAQRRSYRKGEFLFMEGDPASAVFLISAGRVRLFKVSDEGKEIVLGFLTVHDLLGEEVLFADSQRTFSAQAMEPTRICACYKDDFEAMVAQNSAISKKVIQTLGQKLNKMAEHLSDVAIHNTRESVARTLARLAREYGETTEGGLRINFGLTHEELGAMVGASRVMVTNVLKSLAEAGAVYSEDSQHRFVVSHALMAQMENHREAEVLPPQPPCPCFENNPEA